MTFYISAEQVAVMFILMAVGAVAYKFNFIHTETAKDMTNLLLYIVMPCLVINAFQESFSKSRLEAMAILFVFVCASLIISIGIAKLCFNKRTINNFEQRIALRFGTVYTNAGFMGIPLASALLGKNGVFFAIPYLAAYTLFIWTHGIAMFEKNRNASFKSHARSALINPNTIATVIAVLIFIFSIRLPHILTVPLNDIAAINTPLSMIIIGSNIAGIRLNTTLNDKKIWIGTLVRNLIVPLITLALLTWLPISHAAAMATLIMAACPVAGLAVLFSVLNQHDAIFPTKLMCASTLSSIISLPVVLFIASLVL
jgi:predicted permease